MSDENLGIKVHLELPTLGDFDDYFTRLQKEVDKWHIKINTNFNKDVLKGLEQIGKFASTASKDVDTLGQSFGKATASAEKLKEVTYTNSKGLVSKEIEEIQTGLGQIEQLTKKYRYDKKGELTGITETSKDTKNYEQVRKMQDDLNANKIKMLSALESFKGIKGIDDLINQIAGDIHKLDFSPYIKSNIQSIYAQINTLKLLTQEIHNSNSAVNKQDSLDAKKSKMLFSLDKFKGVKELEDMLGSVEKQINKLDITNATKVNIEGIRQQIAVLDDWLDEIKKIEREQKKLAEQEKADNTKKQAMYTNLMSQSDAQYQAQLNRLASKANKGSTLGNNVSLMIGNKAESEYSAEEKRIVKWLTRYKQLLTEYNNQAKLGVKIDESEFRKLEKFESSIKNLQRVINSNTDSHGYSYTKYGEFLESRLNPAIKQATNLQEYYNNSILQGYKLIDTYTQETDKYIKVSQKLRQGSEHKEIGLYVDKNTGKMYQFADSVRNAMTRSWGLGEAIKTAGEKAMIWTSVMGTMYGVLNILQQIPQIIIEIDTRLTEMHKVMPKGTDYGDVMSQLTKSADTYGRTITETQEAVMEFARMGYDAEQSIKLADTALLGANVTLMKTGELASYVTGAMSQFNVSAEDSARIIDKVNEVDNRYSVTSADLTQAISKAGETAQQFGMSLDDLLGAVTAVKTATRESGTVIGNSFKFMLARINSDNAVKALKSVGISTKDMAGDLRSAGQIYGDLASKWDTLSRSQKTYIAEAMAGKHHLTRFMAYMDNFKISIDATHTAETSLFSSLEENTIHMQSLESHINQVKSAFQELAFTIGQKGVAKAMAGALGVVKNFLNGLNEMVAKSDFAKIAVGALVVSLAGLSLGFISLIPIVQTLTSTFLTMSLAVATNPFGALAIAITAIVGTIAVVVGKQREARLEMEKLNKTANEQRETMKRLREEASIGGVATKQDVNDTEARIKRYDDLINKMKVLKQAEASKGVKVNLKGEKVDEYVDVKDISKETKDLASRLGVVIKQGMKYKDLIKELNEARQEERELLYDQKKNSAEYLESQLEEQNTKKTEIKTSGDLIKTYERLAEKRSRSTAEEKRFQEAKLQLMAIFPMEFDGTTKSIGAMQSELQKRYDLIDAMISETETKRQQAIKSNQIEYQKVMNNITQINSEIEALQKLANARAEAYNVDIAGKTYNTKTDLKAFNDPFKGKNPLGAGKKDPVVEGLIKGAEQAKKDQQAKADKIKVANEKFVKAIGASAPSGISGGGGGGKKGGGGGSKGSTSALEAEVERFTSALAKAKAEYNEASKLLSRKIDLGIISGMEKFDEQIRNQESYVDKLFDIPSDLDKSLKDYQAKLIKYKGNTKAYKLIQDQIALINKEKAQTVKLQEAEIQKLKTMKQNYAQLEAIVAKRTLDLKVIAGLVKGTDIGEEKLKIQEDKVNSMFASLNDLDAELAENERVIGINNAKMDDLTRKRNASKKNSKEWKEYERQRIVIANNTKTELGENVKLNNSRSALLSKLTAEIAIRDGITEANEKFNNTLDETALKTEIQFGFVKGFDILEQKLDLSKKKLDSYIDKVKNIDANLLQLQEILNDTTLSPIDRKKVLAMIDTEKKKKDDVLKTLKETSDEYNKQEDYIKKIIDATELLEGKINDIVDGMKDISDTFKDSMDDVTTKLKLNKDFSTDVFGKPEELFDSIDSAYKEKLISLDKFKKKIIRTEGEVGAKVAELLDKQTKGTITEAEQIQLDTLLKTDKNIQKALMENGLTEEDIKLIGKQYRIILGIKKKYENEVNRITKDETYKDSIPYLEKQLELVDAQVEGQREINGLKANEIKLLKIQRDLETVLNDTRFEFITASGEKLLTYDRDRVKELSKDLLKQNIQNKIDLQKDYVDNVLPDLQNKEYNMYLDQWANIQTGEVNVQEAITDTVRTESELRIGYLDTEIQKIGTLTNSIKDLPSTLPVQQQYSSSNYAQYLATPSTGSYVNNSISVSIGNITLQGQQAESLGGLLKDLALSVISRG